MYSEPGVVNIVNIGPIFSDVSYDPSHYRKLKKCDTKSFSYRQGKYHAFTVNWRSQTKTDGKRINVTFTRRFSQ